MRVVEQRRDRLVGGDHQVLDQAVRLGLLDSAARAVDVAVAVEVELRLGRLDGERAAASRARLQRGGRRARGRQRLAPTAPAACSAPAKIAVDLRS